MTLVDLPERPDEKSVFRPIQTMSLFKRGERFVKYLMLHDNTKHRFTFYPPQKGNRHGS